MLDIYKLLTMSAEDSFADVTFVVNTTKFPAHKNILTGIPLSDILSYL